MNLFEHCILPDWPAPKNVRTLQTTRNGGISAAPYNSLNLSSNVGDVPLAVARNRMLLEPMLPSEPVWLKQVHGVAVVDAAQAECWPEADACVSTHVGAVCVVTTADCLPVLLCNDKGSVSVQCMQDGVDCVMGSLSIPCVLWVCLPIRSWLGWGLQSVCKLSRWVMKFVQNLLLRIRGLLLLLYRVHPENGSQTSINLQAYA